MFMFAQLSDRVHVHQLAMCALPSPCKVRQLHTMHTQDKPRRAKHALWYAAQAPSEASQATDGQ